MHHPMQMLEEYLKSRYVCSRGTHKFSESVTCNSAYLIASGGHLLHTKIYHCKKVKGKVVPVL